MVFEKIDKNSWNRKEYLTTTLQVYLVHTA